MHKTFSPPFKKSSDFDRYKQSTLSSQYDVTANQQTTCELNVDESTKNNSQFNVLNEKIQFSGLCNERNRNSPYKHSNRNPCNFKVSDLVYEKDGVESNFRKSLFKSPQLVAVAKDSGRTDNTFHADYLQFRSSQVEDSKPLQTNIGRSQCHYPRFSRFGTNDVDSTRNNQKDKRSYALPMNHQSFDQQSAASQNSSILRPVTEIRIFFFFTAKFRSVFKEFPYFNYIQSKALDDLLYTDKSFVLCAPTGSGKTVLFELAIIRLLMEIPSPWSNIKIVYMAPIKALCSQRYDDWKDKFGPIGLNCKELTGDTEMDDFFEIQEAHIIMTTPEKWDSMTRKWRDNTLVQLVRLFLIDEVHVVKDESRGATLEVVVSRMKTASQSSLSWTKQNPDANISMRFVAVSATIPNIEDISEWFSDEKGPATCLKMDESHRPVKLRKVVLGFPCSSNQTEFKFDLTLNYKIASIIQTYSEQKPALVFCATRKGVQQAASVLAKEAKFIMSIEHKQRLQKYANSAKDSKLRDLLLYGVGYHHAGMDVSDRKIVEGAFAVGDLPVLFTTSTLAIGVNLPAHLVVIKSTMHYVGGTFQEYSETDILQMIGRAGRPQFDTTATAVIMTKFQTKEKYTHLLKGADTIESSLHRHLSEHLNAEIVLHTITDVNVALEWIRSTFLYIRALKNPKYYGFPNGLDKAGIEAQLQDLCLKNLNALASIGLIKMDEEVNFKPTETGRLMARYYIAFETMKQFCLITGTENLAELVTMISSCKEFADIQLRVSEKKILNTLNKDKNRITIRFPLEGKIKASEMKVNCLIQSQLGSIPLQDFALTQDTAKIFRSGIRVAKCLSEFLALQEKKNFSAFLNALILAKCFRAKLWENSPYVSKQLEKIGVTLSTAIVNAGLTTFKKIEDTNARELELILNRHPPFGSQIREAVIHLPKYELSIEQIPRYCAAVAEIVITVALTNHELLQIKRTAPDLHYITLVIGDADNRVAFKQKVPDSLLFKTGSWSKKIEVTRALKGEELSVNLISSDYVGLDIQQKYTVFYSGPKRFGAHVITQEKPPAQSSEVEHKSCREKSSTVPIGLSKEVTCAPAEKKQCGHYCKNKDRCGHDCCKIGILATWKVFQPESQIFSYLSDLRSRNAAIPATPVKRLKMQLSYESQAMDLKQFAFTPRVSMPTSSRSESAQTCQLTPAQGWDHLDVFVKSRQKLQSQFYDFDNSNKEGKNWNSGNLKPQITPLDTADQENISMLKHSVAPIQKSLHMVSSNTDNSDETGSDCWSRENVDVSFDLGDDVWDDFDDENLIHASNISVTVEPKSISETVPGSKSSLLPVATECKTLPKKWQTQFPRKIFNGVQNTPENSHGSFSSTFNSISRTAPAKAFVNEAVSSDETKNTIFSTSCKLNSVDPSKSIGNFNFFTQNHTDTGELEDNIRSTLKDEANDVNAFLGVFDGIF
ncbi:probable ATP-dependent DNA helicase HFM1 [Latimeria chalumnae]|uniref:probable ATP-dependent DNA helicase HFM1 n=1 Tax=Latimeria chalumnae TaxID=7897 RepID=UPI00313BDE95